MDESGPLDCAKQVFSRLEPQQEQARFDALVARIDTDEEFGANVTALASKSRRSRRWTTGLLAVAVALVVALPLMREPAPPSFSAGYQIHFDKLSTTMRGAQAKREYVRIIIGRKLSVRLIPEAAVRDPIEVVVFAVDSSGRARELPVEPLITSKGAIEIEAKMGTLGLTGGRWELVFAIGSEDTLPSSWTELTDAKGSTGYEIVHAKLEIVASQ